MVFEFFKLNSFQPTNFEFLGEDAIKRLGSLEIPKISVFHAKENSPAVTQEKISESETPIPTINVETACLPDPEE